jgi:hypothetical protein
MPTNGSVTSVVGIAGSWPLVMPCVIVASV